jgi:hypothetical protein
MMTREEITKNYPDGCLAVAMVEKYFSEEDWAAHRKYGPEHIIGMCVKAVLIALGGNNAADKRAVFLIGQQLDSSDFKRYLAAKLGAV